MTCERSLTEHSSSPGKREREGGGGGGWGCHIGGTPI